MKDIDNRIEAIETKLTELYKLIGNVLVDRSVEVTLAQKQVNNTRKDLN